MKIQRRTLPAAAALAALLLVTAPLQSHADDMSRQNTQADQMMHKLGRGIVNLFTGFVEVPKNIAREWRKTDPFTGLVLGFIKGAGWGLSRTAAGAYEIVTFPLPVPEGYVPLMEPEFILTDVWGEPIPEVNDVPDWL
jgi:putative exosortase-associated protein (TIGR04073 family)